MSVQCTSIKAKLLALQGIKLHHDYIKHIKSDNFAESGFSFGLFVLFKKTNPASSNGNVGSKSFFKKAKKGRDLQSSAKCSRVFDTLFSPPHSQLLLLHPHFYTAHP